MDLVNQTQTVLGLDIGRLHTRATLFGVVEGKYRLLGQGMAQTSLGAARHLGEGVGAAIEDLEIQCGRKLLNEDGSLIQPAQVNGAGFDRLALSVSVGPPLHTVLTGLAQAGSLRAGRALLGSLPLDPVGVFGLGDFADETVLIDRIVGLRPELIVMTGGETGGAVEPLQRWIETVRRVCLLLPEDARPEILYAGNPALWETVRRRLEPRARLHLAANLLPEAGHYDLVPAQAVLNGLILKKWVAAVPGLKDLARLANDQVACGDFGLNRMLRFLSRPAAPEQKAGPPRGVIAVNLGGGATSLSVGLGGEALSTREGAQAMPDGPQGDPTVDAIHRWMPEEISRDAVAQYFYRRALNPGWVPTTPMELAFEQALVRHRLQRATQRLAGHYGALPYDPSQGWQGHFEPIIASGAVLDRAPLPGQTMLMLLDGLQPQGVTTLVLDRFQILPLLGELGATLSILPVHLLETDAFQNLGTVIAPTSPAPVGEKILTLQVIKETGGDFSVDIEQGILRRIVVQVDEPAVLVLKPERNTDVGFGAPGLGGRLKVTGGTMGVVVDARGRPLSLPEEDEERVALLQRWRWILGAGE